MLEYLGPTETRQQAARIAFTKYKQADDQSVKDYTEHSNHLASQLPEDYSQTERARIYIANMKPAIKHHLPLYQIPHTFKDASEMALHIENNVELLGAETAFAEAMSSRSQGDRSRSISPRKKEALPSQDDCEQNDNHDRQELGGHRQKRKGKSRVRFEERIQPTLPPATPATPTAAGPPTTPWQYPAKQTTTSPYPALPKLADGSMDWQKVQCYGCGQTGHTKKYSPNKGGPGPAGGGQPGSTLTPGHSENDSAQQN
jgi:hypothetical protein